MKDKQKFIIAGTAPNLDEQLDNKYIYDFLPYIKDYYNFIGLNHLILDNSFHYFDYFLTIDVFTYKYLKNFPHLESKMWIDKTVKKEADKYNYLQNVVEVFEVDNQIHTEYNKKLYLNRYNPTALHTALNMALILGAKEVYLLGIQLDSEWKHRIEYDPDYFPPKPTEMIKEMRESVYRFKKYFNVLSTLNKQCTLDLPYTDIRSLLIN